MTFEQALDRHLQAIQDRDLEAFASTVAGGAVVLVSAAGEVSMSSEHLLGLHKEWFASPTWSMQMRRLHTRERGDLATALLELDYRDTADGQPIRARSILSLVFERQRERWLMVQDQNTPITG